MEIVVTESLQKVYDDGTEALKEVNICCQEGKLYCVLGPNGAGKTTLIRVLSTQLLPTAGNAYVLGFDLLKEAEKIRNEIVAVPQDAGPVASMTPWQHVYWYLVSRGYSRSDAKNNARMARKLVELWDVKDKYSIKLSGGQRKRIIVAMALATDAKVLFLDEPTAGLDPIGRRKIWESLRKIVRERRTIILTTHHMDEAEMLADEVIMINNGRIIISGNPSMIKTLVNYKLKVIIDGNVMYSFDDLGEVTTVGDRTIIYLNDDKKLPDLVSTATNKGISITIRPIDLEDAFFKLVGGEK